MGTLSYGDVVVHIDDRALTHLQIVIVNKLRKGEGFMMSWKDSPEVGDGRSAVWMHPYMIIHFKFDGGRVPSINEQWLAELAASADSSRGLIITAENGNLSSLDEHRGSQNSATLAVPATDAHSVAPDSI
jgi:hypothetical protein